MIEALRGTLVARTKDGIVLEVSGVSYLVAYPLGDHHRLPETGSEFRALTHLVVREDAFELFGFPTPAARVLFRLLIGVPGVGPRTGFAVLSHLGADRAQAAIVRKDVASLTRVPGIGKKTAIRFVTELADKVAALSVGLETSLETGDVLDVLGDAQEEAVAALVALGYAAAESRDLVRAAVPDPAGLGTAEIVTKALARVMSARR